MLLTLFHMLALLGALAAGGTVCAILWHTLAPNAGKIARALHMAPRGPAAPLFPDPSPARMRPARRARPMPMPVSARRVAA